LQFFLGGEGVPRHEHLVFDLLMQDVANLRMERTYIIAVDPRLQLLGRHTTLLNICVPDVQHLRHSSADDDRP
jgi:hypothetical protein